METFLHSLSSVAIILLLTATGYFCAAKGWMKDESKTFLSKLLMSIVVPANCIYCMRQRLSRDMLTGMVSFLLIPLLATAIMFLASYLLARALKVEHKRFGVFIMMCALPNCVFIGLPVCRELFGEECIPYVMLYFVISTVYTQTLAMALVRASGTADDGKRENILLRLIKMPTLIGTVIGVVLVLCDIELPGLAMTYLGYLSDTVSPLALLITGFIIHDIGLKNLYIDKQTSIVLCFRFLIAPALFLTLCSLFGITGLARSVTVIECSMPVVSQTVIAAAAYGADEQFAARGAAISTIACFAVIPLLMLILG